MSLMLADIDQLVHKYADSMLEDVHKKDADLQNPLINWDKMQVIYGETEYARSDIPAVPELNVLFSANFANNTPNPRTFTLRTQRTTKSSCSFTFKKIFTYGGGIQIKLSAPISIVEANAGFQTNITKEKSACPTYEQELTWSVDSEIVVPTGRQTKAELVIREDRFNGEFQVLATFEGKVLVTYFNKKTREYISTVTVPMANLLTEKDGFSRGTQNQPTFMIKGECKCKFGVEQTVTLTESAIP